jgi:hypothetical protein
MSTSGLIDEARASLLLGLNPKTLRRWRWAGKGPPFCKIGGAVRYDPKDLDAFVQSSRKLSTSDYKATAMEIA